MSWAKGFWRRMLPYLPLTRHFQEVRHSRGLESKGIKRRKNQLFALFGIGGRRTRFRNGNLRGQEADRCRHPSVRWAVQHPLPKTRTFLLRVDSSGEDAATDAVPSNIWPTVPFARPNKRPAVPAQNVDTFNLSVSQSVSPLIRPIVTYR